MQLADRHVLTPVPPLPAPAPPPPRRWPAAATPMPRRRIAAGPPPPRQRPAAALPTPQIPASESRYKQFTALYENQLPSLDTASGGVPDSRAV